MAIPFASRNGLAIGILLLVLLATPLTAYLVYQNQNPQSLASGSAGVGTMTVSPTSLSLATGETKQVKVFINSGGKAVNLAQAVLTYPYSGSAPAVVASGVALDSTLRNNDWACGILKVEAVAPNVEISISCTNSGETGYVAPSNTLFATFNLTANSVPTANPFQLTFKPADSYLLEKVSGPAVDILQTPTSAVAVSVTQPNSNSGTHKVCINNACALMAGVGTDQCSSVGASCTSTFSQQAATSCNGKYDPNCYNCVDDSAINILDFACFGSAYGKQRTTGVNWQ